MKPHVFPTLCLMLAAAVIPMRAQDQPTASSSEPLKDIRVVIHTDKGDIEGTLFANRTPVTVANFLNLAQRKFYDGLKFHRVIAGFMIQGGSPDGSGSGGPGYRFEDEVNNGLTFNKAGLFAMANAGAGTNGSQFFITHVPTPHLNNKHTIFGEVTKGQGVVTATDQGDRIKSIDILDSTKPLFEKEASRIKDWNAALDKTKRGPATAPF